MRSVYDIVSHRSDAGAKSACAALELVALRVVASAPAQFGAAIGEIVRQRSQAVVVVSDGMYYAKRAKLQELLQTTRLPVAYLLRDHVVAGGLLSYGADLAANYRNAAKYVDKILKDARPADLPVEQATKFELVINLRTAKALGRGRGDSVIDRRTFIGGAAIGLVAVPLAAKAQQARTARIGWLAIDPLPELRDALRQGLKDRGYVEPQNLVIEERYAHGRVEHFAGLAAELVRLNLDALMTIGTAATVAAQHATTTLPIVFVVGDPVAAGFVASLSHPGGNLTGFAIIASELNGKRVELLKEAVPGMARLAVLRDVTAAASSITSTWRAIDAAASKAAIQLMPALDLRSADDLDAAFAAAVKERVDGILIGSSPLFGASRQQVVALASKARLPAIYEGRRFVEVGGLMSCGPNTVDMFRRAGIYIDKILKGAKPADLPVEQPTKIELVINLKTAKALGLAIPQSLLLRADEVIE
jgi:putative tryptophan/tyrosine transport system substrate-binding protein